MSAGTPIHNVILMCPTKFNMVMKENSFRAKACCFEGAELAVFLEPLGMHCKKTIFIPVNSNSNPEAIGGTHWLVSRAVY